MPSGILRHSPRPAFCILAGAILAGALTLGTARTAHAETQRCKISALQVAPDKYVLIRCSWSSPIPLPSLSQRQSSIEPGAERRLDGSPSQ